MSTSVIAVRELRKVFGAGPTAYEALRGVDLDVEPGEFLMLVGPSGSGKTTLLSILGCVLRPTSGRVSLFGQGLTSLSEGALAAMRRDRVGFIFQGHNLIASLPAIDNVALVQEMRGVPRRAAREEAAELLAAVGLAGREQAVSAALSGGQRQRVAIARALAGAPSLVLADEPTAALDAASGLAAVTLLRELTQARGTTVLCVTHDNRIYKHADRIVAIEDGRMLPPGALA
jgi:putative ABC transport system ATP-binding protein